MERIAGMEIPVYYVCQSGGEIVTVVLDALEDVPEDVIDCPIHDGKHLAIMSQIGEINQDATDAQNV